MTPIALVAGMLFCIVGSENNGTEEGGELTPCLEVLQNGEFLWQWEESKYSVPRDQVEVLPYGLRYDGLIYLPFKRWSAAWSESVRISSPMLGCVVRR